MLHHIKQLFGVEFYTDYLPLVQALETYLSECQSGTIYIEDAVPGITFTVMTLKKELKDRGLESKFAIYANHVIQIWPEQISNEPTIPSSAIILIPEGFPGALKPKSYSFGQRDVYGNLQSQDKCASGGLVDAPDLGSGG